mgnify:CR=1 FL=1
MDDWLRPTTLDVGIDGTFDVWTVGNWRELGQWKMSWFYLVVEEEGGSIEVLKGREKILLEVK